MKHRVPSYLGSSASFVGVATAIYAAGGNPRDVTGALFVVALTLFMVGLIIHFAGARVIHRALPPVVTGAVVMLIGFNLAPVVAGVYWPVDPWLAFIVMLIVITLGLSSACAASAAASPSSSPWSSATCSAGSPTS